MINLDLNFFKENADHHITANKQAFIEHFNLQRYTDTEIAWMLTQQMKVLGIAAPVVYECPICEDKTLYTLGIEGASTEMEMLDEFDVEVDGIKIKFTRPDVLLRFEELNMLKTVALVQSWTDTDLTTIPFQTMCKVIDAFSEKMFSFTNASKVTCKNGHEVEHDFALGITELLKLLEQMC